MSKGSEIAALIESACCGPEALTIAAEIVEAIARAVGVPEVAAIVEKIATIANDPTAQAAATAAAFATTDAVEDAHEAERLAEITTHTKDP